MVELLARAALEEEGNWAERWGWGRRWYLRFWNDRMGNVGGVDASLSASTSVEDDKTHSES